MRSDAKPSIGAYDRLFDLASGGMATATIAKHRAARGFERLVIVKRIHPHLAVLREFCDMFVDEARLASQIRDPNVVPVDDIVDANGELYLVQPYIESVSLAALLEAAKNAGERLAPSVASRIVGDALAGLEGAHNAVDLRGERLAIIHRDVSPANILVGTDGRSRVIDFGIAKAARRLTITKSGMLKGKVAYMAPEALRRTPIDARADVFSAGVVLYEALTGVRPFDGEDEGDTLLSILLGDPDPPSSRVEGLPALVDEVIANALAVSRDARFATASAMHEALDRAIPPAPARDVAETVNRLAGRDLEARRERVRACLDGVPEVAHAAPRRRGMAAVIAVIGVASLGLGLAWIKRAEPGVPTPPPSSSIPVITSTASIDSAPSALASIDPSPPPSAAPVPVPRRAPTAPRPADKPAASAPELHPNPYAGAR